MPDICYFIKQLIILPLCSLHSFYLRQFMAIHMMSLTLTLLLLEPLLHIGVFLLENRHDAANFRTADKHHKIWRFCFQFHGIAAVVRQDTLSCTHLRQQYDQDWSSGSSAAALVGKPHVLSRLHYVQLRFAAFVGAHTRSPTFHREITPSGLYRPRFHAPLHIFPPPPGPAGGPSPTRGKRALVGGI